jgi:hypothetical protein
MGVTDEIPRGASMSAPRDLLTHHDAHPVAIHKLLDRTFGFEWLAWDPDALWQELKDEFGSVVSELSRSKIQALRSLHANEFFWNNWEIFCPVVQSLNNRIPNFWIMQKPSIAQLYTTIDMVGLVRDMPYGKEVSKFIAAAFMNDGVFYAPPPLDFIQGELSSPRYQCSNCGQIAHDFSNKACDSCGSTSIDRYNNVEVGELKPKIDSILKGEIDDLKEEPEDIQGAKLLVAMEYMKFRRKQFDSQSSLVGNRNA